MLNTDKLQTIDDCWNQIGTWRKGDAICSKLENEIHCQNCSIYKEAGLYLLDRALPEHYKDNNTLTFSIQKEELNTNLESFLIFNSGNEWHALDTSVLDEVCAFQPVHKLPNSPSEFIAGLVNIRGEIEICISLSNLLDYHANDIESVNQKLIVIQLDHGRFAIPADEIHGIFKINASDILAPPASVSQNEQSMINGIIAHDNHHAGILNLQNLERKLALI